MAAVFPHVSLFTMSATATKLLYLILDIVEIKKDNIKV